MSVQRPILRSRLRLLCFPYAGGGATALMSWDKLLPASMEPRTIQLPGRGSLFREAPFTAFASLVRWFIRKEGPTLRPPYALFGHSLGALVAFEVTRQLRRMDRPLPLCLVVSGRTAPQLPDPNEPVHGLAPDVFKARLRSLGGTPPELLDNEELMDLVLPTLRADFQISETYRYTHEPPLPCPIVALGGKDDETTPVEALLPWREQTAGRFRHHLFPGGHFFIHSAAQLVVDTITSELHDAANHPSATAS